MSASYQRNEPVEDEDTVLRAYLQWVDTGNALSGRFKGVGHALPLKLRQFLGNTDSPKDRAVVIPRMERPFPFPAGADETWLWIPAGSAEIKTLVLGLLKANPAGLHSRNVATIIGELAHTSEGTVANAGTQLSKAGQIVRVDGQWMLAPNTAAPHFEQKFLVGPPAVFRQYDIACFRRMAIKHVLRLMGGLGGLQASQIVELLGRCEWALFPKDKDVIKQDLEQMRARGEIGRNNAKKWVIREDSE